MEPVKHPWCIELRSPDSNEIVGRVHFDIVGEKLSNAPGFRYVGTVHARDGSRTNSTWIRRKFEWEGGISPDRIHDGKPTRDRMIEAFCSEFDVDDLEVVAASEVGPDRVSGG